jgi:hypothetical protein
VIEGDCEVEESGESSESGEFGVWDSKQISAELELGFADF